MSCQHLSKGLITLVNTNQIKPAVAPIAFDYLHGPLLRAGYDIELLDLCFADDVQAEIRQYCSRRAPQFWGVTLRNIDDTYFGSQKSFITLVAEMVAELRRARPVPVIFGGVGFSVLPERVLERCAGDYGIICEGEVALPALLDALRNGSSLTQISGLVYREHGVWRRNPVEFADLDATGPRTRRLIDNSRYFLHGGQAALETKRGCPRTCIYCVEPLVKGRKLRLRSPQAAVDEMEALCQRGLNVFHINDSEFNLDVKHAREFCAEIERRGLERRLRWYAYGMPAPFSIELATAMQRAGCAGINFGTDSASPRMLRVLKRTFGQAHIAKAVEICESLGIEYMIELLLGGPGETADSVRETIDFMRTIDAAKVSVTAGLRVFPGTELERMVQSEGFSEHNPNLFGSVQGNADLLAPVFYLSAQIAPDPLAYIAELCGNDPRFFGVNTQDFNYNANELLVQAIARGERGAYWSMLSRLTALPQKRSA